MVAKRKISSLKEVRVLKKFLKFGFPFLAASIILSGCADVEEEENEDVEEVEDLEE